MRRTTSASGRARRSHSPGRGGSGGDARARLEIDDERRALERRIAFDLERSARRNEPDVARHGSALRLRGNPVARRANAARRLDQPGLGQPALLHRGDDRGLNLDERVLREIVTEAERVRAGPSARTAPSSTPMVALIARISSASVITIPSKPSSQRSRSWRITRLVVAGTSSSAGTRMCAVMIEAAPASIAARNGGSAFATNASRSSWTTGSSRCESASVSPCPGKCFAHAATPWPWRPRTKAATCLADEPGIRAERPDPDDRVQRIRVHVGDRREVEVDADRGEIGADRGGDLLGEVDVVDSAERSVPGVRAPVRRLEPRDVAALLVDGHEKVAALGAQQVVQSPELNAVVDVPRIEHDAPESSREPVANPVGRHVAREAREEARRREALELLAHPLTDPAVSPNAILRWTRRKKTTTGIAVKRRRRHQRAPVRVPARTEEVREPDREGLVRLVAQEDVREDELVPDGDEDEHRRRHEPGRHERQEDAA